MKKIKWHYGVLAKIQVGSPFLHKKRNPTATKWFDLGFSWWRWWESATQGGRAALATKFEKKYYSHLFARSREPTIIRTFSQLPSLPNAKKTPQKGVLLRLVEMVGIEPTSYSAAKKLSTYLVYLFFLKTQRG